MGQIEKVIKKQTKGKVNSKKTNKPTQSNDLFVVKDESGCIIGEYDDNYIDVIKKTVAKGSTDQELYMFLQICASYELNPFKKEIWFTKFNGKVNIMVSRDGYMKLAKQDPNFICCNSDVVCEKDSFTMERNMGKVVNMPHSYNQDDRGKIIGAYAVLEHRGGEPIVAYVDFDEYNQKQTSWKSYPRAMITKVAENIVYKRFAGITGIDAVENMPKQFLADANRKNTTDFKVIDSEIID